MSLSILSTPGITIAKGMVIDEAVLNQLGNISVTLTGTSGPTDLTAGDYSNKLVAGPYFYGPGALAAGVYTVTLVVPPVAYSTGLLIAFQTNAANSGAVSVQVGALASLALLKPDGTPFAANELPSGSIVCARHNGTAFQVISPWIPQNVTIPGTFGVTGASTFTGAATFNGAMALGKDSTSLLTLNGTLAGSPTLTAKATPLAADVVVIGDSAAAGALKATTITALKALGLFTSAAAAVPATSSLTNVAHGLAAMPSWVRVVLVCTTTDLGYSVGDEVELAPLITASAGDQYPAFTLRANATNVSLQRSNVAGVYVNRISAVAGTLTLITEASWNYKVYTRL
jgi:hypothetical protein